MTDMNPKYVIESFFRGDTSDITGSKCHWRRYVVDVYVHGDTVQCGSLKLKHSAGILYYLGNVPVDGIKASVSAETKRRPARGTAPMPKENPDNLPFYGYDLFKTETVTISWSSEKPIDASNEKVKIARIMMCFGRWGMEYSEIECRTPEEIISRDSDFTPQIDGKTAEISENVYLGTVPFDSPQMPPEFPKNTPCGALLSRFAILSDAHVGIGYKWDSYGWLHRVFDNLEELHGETPLDFVVWLGDNIDDGYAASYQTDYSEYLREIKNLKICDPDNPTAPADKRKIPMYELQGNHDTSNDTRFIRDSLWYTENSDGQKVAYVSFFSSYGGYPLVNFNIAGNHNSYRSFGKISDETVSFVDKSIEEAKANGAKHVVLLSHFGISQDLSAPILPESGLGKIESVCKKHDIKLFFNGHEHNPSYTHRMYGRIHDFDASMLSDKYAVAEIYENVCKLTVYNTSDGQIYKEEFVSLM